VSAVNIELCWGVKIPLRDGVHLNATLYLPKCQSAPAPSIVAMTPYIADYDHGFGVYFASQGMPCAIVDVRGRGNSEGVFHPMIQEAHDGYDVVEWLARQPCCNGKVAMWGASYGGYSQWATAKEFPPHLAALVPTAAPCAGVDFPMRGNIFYPFLVRWLLLTSGHALQLNIFMDRALWAERMQAWYASGKPFRELDIALGYPSLIFQEWLDHPEAGEYWDAYNPTAEQYAQLKIPILTITGSYDDDQPGALEHYRQHMHHATPEARGKHYLIIGPWNHGGTITPQAEFGGLQFGPDSVVDLKRLHVEWFGWTMGRDAKPAFLKAPVAYYVMGAQKWRYAQTFDAVTARHHSYFLDSDGKADDVFGSGSLQRRPGSGQPDAYTYNPGDTAGAEIAAEAKAPNDSLVDQTVALALCGKAAFYHSAPFEVDTEISGFFKLSAWIAIDCPDTDFYVSVHESTLEGQSIRLSTDVLRARYREGPRTAKLIRTREPLRYDFERFTFVSRQIKRGHRLRLIIAPVGRLVDAAFTQRNFNGGSVIAEESIGDAKAVTVRVFHDEVHPSVLHIPLGHTESQNLE
jgi:putative CocE/NonD family hydrolase